MDILGFIKNIFTSKVKKSIYDHFSGADDTNIIYTREDKNNDAVILFIHGFGGNAKDTWGKFPELVTKDSELNGWNVIQFGYNTRLMPDINGIWSSNPDLNALSLFLKTSINNNFRKNHSQIAIVAHSMGGLITQRAILDILKKKEDFSMIHSVTLYGTPSNGLKKAQAGQKYNNQVHDMALGSDFVTQLRADWNELIGDKPSFKFTTCAGDLDDFVPEESSLTPFSSDFHEGVNGNHVDIVKPADNKHSSYLVLRSVFLDEKDFYKGEYDSAEIAIQMGNFKRVLEKLAPQKDKLGKNQIRDYAFALEATENREAAIEFLKTQGAETDTLGTLGGRYKRNYLTHYKESDLQEAFKLYELAYNKSKEKENNFEQIFYHAINLAFLSLKMKKNDDVKKFAEIALENAEASTEKDVWKYATIGEANIYLGNEAEALYNYIEALERRTKGDELWQKDSMVKNWLNVVKDLGLEKLEKRLSQTFDKA